MVGWSFQEEFYHFCRPLEDGANVSFMRLQCELLEAGVLRFLPLGGSGVYALRTQAVFEFIQKRLEVEPFLLLTNPPQAYYAFVNGKDMLVESLGGGFSSYLFGLDSKESNFTL